MTTLNAALVTGVITGQMRKLKGAGRQQFDSKLVTIMALKVFQYGAI